MANGGRAGLEGFDPQQSLDASFPKKLKRKHNQNHPSVEISFSEEKCCVDQIGGPLTRDFLYASFAGRCCIATI